MEIVLIIIGFFSIYFALLTYKLVKILKEKVLENNRLNKLAEFSSNQISLDQKSKNAFEQDHSLSIRVADEIVRLKNNLSRMDENIRGYKQIKASVRKLEQSLNSKHYDLEDLLNKNYDNGMNLQASFIEDENLELGERIITRIIKPQINYKGKLIQAAQVEVSQGF